MVALLALAAAVAGGNLAVTAAPLHPHTGQDVLIRSTGQVGDTGRLYLYRNAGRRCGDSQRAERQIGRLVASRPINGSFDFEVGFRTQRTGTTWVCGYLYAINCDAAGLNCGPATGLPPDAGFDQVRVKVRSSSQSVKSSAASGRVIT